MNYYKQVAPKVCCQCTFFTSFVPPLSGVEKLKEWVALEGEGEKAPKIRLSRPITAMPFEGTRKRRRATIGDYNWSIGDRVDAWIQDR